ncbi:MAG: PEP/pyruvate-binding domain-containing protein [Kofleriaceae bacterium]
MYRSAFIVAVITATSACGDQTSVCETGTLAARTELRCEQELRAQAARPLDASLPGAITIKTIVDRANGDSLTFQDTGSYPLHRSFAVDHLGWPAGAPFLDQYFAPQRRFLLGSLTYYEEPGVFAYELAPYDTADAEMIATAFRSIAASTYFGDQLVFHPTSEEQVALAKQLPADIATITTEQLWRGITYQPLNLGETYARVRVVTAEQLETTYVSPREIAVLDRVPNDLSVVAAVVTDEFQTPLSHINVLSQQRGTPNMGLDGAAERFTAFEGRWVRLTVRAFDWEVVEVSADEAEAWWQAHRPPPAEIPAPDYTVTTVLDIDTVGVDDIPAIGGKAAHYGALRDIGSMVHIRPALAIPMAFYRQFIVGNGFDSRIAAMLADPGFRGDGNVRRTMLDQLRADMLAAPVDASALAAIESYLVENFPDTRMKFRSSTNAEDLARHTGAGLYDSKSGEVGDPERPIDVALKTVWASVWNVRAFEERDYAGIDHLNVAMGVLANPSFSDEDANGVAITANVYDPQPGGEDALFVNAQVGEESVVQPEPGATADSLMYYHFHVGQPATYYTRSNLNAGQPVLSRSELFELGEALRAIRNHFSAIYQPPAGYGRLPMDVEWKVVDDGTGVRRVWIKQARPFPGRGR